MDLPVTVLIVFQIFAFIVIFGIYSRRKGNLSDIRFYFFGISFITLSLFSMDYYDEDFNIPKNMYIINVVIILLFITLYYDIKTKTKS